jgi:hypothetical protein
MMSPDSSKKENRIEERSVLNTVLNTNTTIRLVRSFSIPLEKVHILNKFSEIARREAGSRGFSEVLLHAMDEYVKNHEEGNPQLKLTTYIDENAPSPAYVLCLHIDGVTSAGKIHCKRAGMWIQGIRCYPCEHNRLRKNT